MILFNDERSERDDVKLKIKCRVIKKRRVYVFA